MQASAIDLTEQYKLAYELALRSLAQQQDSLASVRARAGTLIAAVSISTSFLGGAAVASGPLGVWGIMALVFFGLAMAFSIIVLWPRGVSKTSRDTKERGWFFRVEPSTLVAKIDEQETLPLSAWYKGLAQEIGRHLPANDRRIGQFLRCLQALCLCLLIEMVTWVMELV